MISWCISIGKGFYYQMLSVIVVFINAMFFFLNVEITVALKAQNDVTVAETCSQCLPGLRVLIINGSQKARECRVKQQMGFELVDVTRASRFGFACSDRCEKHYFT